MKRPLVSKGSLAILLIGAVCIILAQQCSSPSYRIYPGENPPDFDQPL